MSEPSKWREVFAGRNDPLAYVLGIVATAVAQNALNELLEHFVGPIGPLDVVWWALSILAIAVGLTVYVVVVQLGKKT